MTVNTSNRFFGRFARDLIYQQNEKRIWPKHAHNTIHYSITIDTYVHLITRFLKVEVLSIFKAQYHLLTNN